VPIGCQTLPAFKWERRSDRDAADKSFLQAMRENPDVTIGDRAESIGKGRSSTVSALKRLVRDSRCAHALAPAFKFCSRP
jgi:hypothetical protein